MTLGHSVPGPAPQAQGQQAATALTASFVAVPTEHDGSSRFWLELSFDAAVAPGSRRHIRALLGATGGTVKKLRRKNRRLDRWQLQVEPSSHGAVTVSPSPACGATGAAGAVWPRILELVSGCSRPTAASKAMAGTTGSRASSPSTSRSRLTARPARSTATPRPAPSTCARNPCSNGPRRSASASQ